MEKILKVLNNRFNLKLEIRKEFILIQVFNKNNDLISGIYCNFNQERTTYSYFEFREMFGRMKEHHVSKKKLLEYIADLIKYPNLKYKRINEF